MVFFALKSEYIVVDLSADSGVFEDGKDSESGPPLTTRK